MQGIIFEFASIELHFSVRAKVMRTSARGVRLRRRNANAFFKDGRKTIEGGIRRTPYSEVSSLCNGKDIELVFFKYSA